MIYEALEYLRLKLNAFITDDRAGAEPVMVLANPWSNNDSSKSFNFLNALSLISIEEDRVFKTQGFLEHRPEKEAHTRRAPDIKLNLFIMISAYNRNYEDALKLISKVVTYFQINSVFAADSARPNATDSFLKGIEKLVVELQTVTFEQQNQIWASLSTGYLPSVIYKVKMLVIDADRQNEYPRVKKIGVASGQDVQQGIDERIAEDIKKQDKQHIK